MSRFGRSIKRRDKQRLTLERYVREMETRYRENVTPNEAAQLDDPHGTLLAQAIRDSGYEDLAIRLENLSDHCRPELEQARRT